MKRDLRIEFDRVNMQRMVAMATNKEVKEYNILSDDELLLLCLQKVLRPYAVRSVELLPKSN